MSSRKAASRTAAKKSASGGSAKPRKRTASARAAAAVRRAEPAEQRALDEEALRLAAAIDEALAQGRLDRLGSKALQTLMAALCRIYRMQVDAGADYLPIPGRAAVAPTDVMVACGALLRAADLQVFELGMWQSFTGR